MTGGSVALSNFARATRQIRLARIKQSRHRSGPCKGLGEQAIRALVIQVQRFASTRETSARKAREMWQRHLRDRAAHQLPDATRFPPPTVH
jgi:hypothetical protein